MSYRIEDEPRPGPLAHLVVNPLWPLFAVMFGGAGVSWPWFVFNGLAVGSPTRRREIVLAVGGFLGSFALILAIVALADAELLSRLGVRYAFLALTVWKLGVSYWLYTLQSRSFGLYEYFGGRARNGVLVVVIGFLVVRRLYAELPFLLMLVVS